jgi:hypothetical protein
MVQTPVGVRCPDCARPTRIPTFDVGLIHYARAAIVGAIAGGGLGYVWALVSQWTASRFWVLNYVFIVAIAYIVAEAVSLSVNRKRGRGLAVVSILGLGLAIIVAAFVSTNYAAVRGITNSFYGFLFIFLAVYIAAQRATR